MFYQLLEYTLYTLCAVHVQSRGLADPGEGREGARYLPSFHLSISDSGLTLTPSRPNTIIAIPLKTFLDRPPDNVCSELCEYFMQTVTMKVPVPKIKFVCHDKHDKALFGVIVQTDRVTSESQRLHRLFCYQADQKVVSEICWIDCTSKKSVLIKKIECMCAACTSCRRIHCSVH